MPVERLKQRQEAKTFPIYISLPCTKYAELISLISGYNFSPRIFRVISRIVKDVSKATSEIGVEEQRKKRRAH